MGYFNIITDRQAMYMLFADLFNGTDNYDLAGLWMTKAYSLEK